MSKLLVPFMILTVAGCAQQQSATTTAPVNTSLSSLMKDGNGSSPPVLIMPEVKPTEVEKLASEYKVDVQSALDREVKIETVEPPVAAAPAEPEIPATSPPPPKTLAEKIDEASLLLTDLLRQKAAETGEGGESYRAALALAAMEAVRKGSAVKVITPDSTDGGPLTDEERTIVDAFRELVVGLAAAECKPDVLTDIASNLGNQFLRARPMKIKAVLAAKVTGFGQYMPLLANRVQQGKPMRAVVYTEVTRFKQEEIKGTDRFTEHAQPGDRYAVELSQELHLIHDADGLKAWQRPEQPVIETSRSYRSDFYLVQNITLPATLSIGKYKLKVIVRDKLSGHLEETILPLEVVADPTLVSESGTKLYD